MGITEAVSALVFSGMKGYNWFYRNAEGCYGYGCFGQIWFKKIVEVAPFSIASLFTFLKKTLNA